MKTFLLIIFALLVLQNSVFCQRKSMKYDRLPPNIMLETEVRKDVLNAKKEVVSVEVTTVEKRLNELRARYKKNKLVDAKGREIRFFEPLCRGVSRGIDEDEQDQREKDKELTELKKKFTVVVLYCDPRKAV
jgi:hypothetical protein